MSKEVPISVREYAFKRGYPNYSHIMDIDGVSFYYLYSIKDKGKIGSPLFVKIVSNKVVEASHEESRQIIIESSK